MTTQEVAKRYYELIQQHQYKQIQDELYAPNAISIESENDTNLPLVVEGIEALQQKEGLFFSQVDQMFGGKMSELIVSNFHFSQMTEMDVKMKGKERAIKGQIGVFEAVTIRFDCNCVRIAVSRVSLLVSLSSILYFYFIYHFSYYFFPILS